ncbi:hypothetical protein JCM31826_08840 [Thermaurantimonas aggregans]|uniref:Uncharacterized protein n=1 Tax=Thermaurantimonas aggregans TaxID=2173829 RepID=A0A401XK73_9FLAO|nr:DUF5606 domain-containing protein [Thermaurantimonas aggregans]MCX8148521.1 DUF5606 domain-containing protein [Thermaurantimonas aggregans]GCD77402.1 hypothetical protein JCM31826_08840 [Thermaurantimonas aggregans]
MDLKKIIAVTGKPGLYKLITTTRTGILVESLTDGRKMPVSANQNASSLYDISMFTYGDDKPLREILADMYKHYNGQKAPSHKESESVLRSEFEKFFPDYDKERVYLSDIKKVFQWYNTLVELGLADDQPEPVDATAEKSESSTTAEETQQ